MILDHLFEEQDLILSHKNWNLDSKYTETSFHVTKMWLFKQYVWIMSNPKLKALAAMLFSWGKNMNLFFKFKKLTVWSINNAVWGQISTFVLFWV